MLKDIKADLWSALLSDKVFGPELRNLLEIGGLIWQRGWAEANAGNVSLRLPPELAKSVELLSGKSSKGLDWYLVSASGSRYREYSKLGFANFVLAGIDNRKTPDKMITKQIIIPDSRKPTSEWITHQSIHNWLSSHRSENKVVLHAHPTDWIIISNLPEYQNNKQSLAMDISASLPEVNIYFPSGFVLLPHAAPGSLELAELTVSALKESSIIIWEKHGIVITADNISSSFDYLEIMAKAAAVYLASRK